jgi:hypothetical protein
MNRVLKHEFVETIPAILQDGTIYVCIPYSTAVHKCACGCGNEVVTPITPTDWQLTFDGETISLYPSVGSWNLPCQSHYFIRRNKMQWSYQWSRDEIAAGRAREEREKKQYFNGNKKAQPTTPNDQKGGTLWRNVKKRFSRGLTTPGTP